MYRTLMLQQTPALGRGRVWISRERLEGIKTNVQHMRALAPEPSQSILTIIEHSCRRLIGGYYFRHTGILTGYSAIPRQTSAEGNY